ncbi:MAG: NAD-dependent epimerase/dehydratase family protein [Bdellovibrionales bacterium]|nr:NAD-dependent epimerase/dehydratase family protein [Bdellovibrionales bacterium]
MGNASNHSDQKKSTVLITGGAGFIGTHVARLLTREGISVRSLDLKDPRNAVDGVDYLHGDVRKESDLRKAIQGCSAVYHFAAIVNVGECQEKPGESYATNFMGTIQVLEAIQQEGARTGSMPKIIFAGSSAVYGKAGKKNVPISESDVSDHPLSFYANQKLASEQAIRLYSEHRKVPAVVFRFFNVFGVGQDPTSPYSGVITIFSRLAREGKDLQLHGGGEQTRDFISVIDIARANLAALRLDPKNSDGQGINLGTGKSVTIRELGETILRVSKSRSQLINTPAREGDVPHSLADVKRAKQVLNWESSVDLQKGLAELL